MRVGFLGTVAAFVVFFPCSAWPGIDAPGAVSFRWVADDEIVFERPELPSEDAQPESIQAEAWFNSRASHFEDGVMIWCGFLLGDSVGTLILDLDLSAGLRPGPEGLRVEYLEKKGEEILFRGSAPRSRVVIQDVVPSSGDDGAIEIRFELVVADPEGAQPGSRLILSGQAVTRPGPVRVETGCGVGVDQGGTEGEYEEESITSCEGDDWDVEDDDGDDDDDDWEGDTWDDDDDSIWEGDTWDEDEQGLTDASTVAGRQGRAPEAGCAIAPPPRRRPDPFRNLMRFFPELAGLAFIRWMKKRNRSRNT
jgi:hypothetical protein